MEGSLKTCYGDIEERVDEVDKKFWRFKKFEVLPCPPKDHHFLNYQTTLNEILPRKSLAKTIKEEWKILEESLPNWIFVRAYEYEGRGRIDHLMRAAIAGLEKTPYRYGLFFFDILVPYNYPEKPPQVFYHSYRHSLNNRKLHRDGRVSLPLLEDRNWVSRRFNILEILEYIQHSVLNYQEPVPKLEFELIPYSVMTYEKSVDYYKLELEEQSEKERKKRKVIFMQTCEAMLSIMETPPQDFGDFVAGYFRKWAHRILLCYKEEMDKQKQKQNLDLQMFIKLLQAFEACGTYCRHHYDHNLMSMLKNNKAALKDQSDHKDDTILNTVSNVFKYRW